MGDSGTVTQTDIESGLRRLGLNSGDLVFVHSSLSSFGRVERGADAVVDAILNVIGPQGTLAVPTFRYMPECFDPAETTSVVGRITEVVRLRPNAIRSLHPTHSVAAIGRWAKQLTEGHEDTHPFGEGSPLHKLYLMDGKLLLLGVTHRTTSIIHVAEEVARMPYLDRTREARIRTPNGIVRKMVRRPGCSQGFAKIDDELESTRQASRLHIGECLAQLIPARAIVDTAVDLLQRDPAALLCDRPDCGICAESRAKIAAIEAARLEAEYGPIRMDPVRRVVKLLGDADIGDSEGVFHRMSLTENTEDMTNGENHTN